MTTLFPVLSQTSLALNITILHVGISIAIMRMGINSFDTGGVKRLIWPPLQATTVQSGGP